MVFRNTKHAVMTEELCRVIKKENIAFLHNQYPALRAGLPFISGLLSAARAPFLWPRWETKETMCFPEVDWTRMALFKDGEVWMNVGCK